MLTSDRRATLWDGTTYVAHCVAACVAVCAMLCYAVLCCAVFVCVCDTTRYVIHANRCCSSKIINTTVSARVVTSRGQRLFLAVPATSHRFPHRALLTCAVHSAVIELLVPAWSNGASASGGGTCIELVDIRSLRQGLPEKVGDSPARGRTVGCTLPPTPCGMRTDKDLLHGSAPVAAVQCHLGHQRWFVRAPHRRYGIHVRRRCVPPAVDAVLAHCLYCGANTRQQSRARKR